MKEENETNVKLFLSSTWVYCNCVTSGSGKVDHRVLLGPVFTRTCIIFLFRGGYWWRWAVAGVIRTAWVNVALLLCCRHKKKFWIKNFKLLQNPEKYSHLAQKKPPNNHLHMLTSQYNQWRHSLRSPRGPQWILQPVIDHNTSTASKTKLHPVIMTQS